MHPFGPKIFLLKSSIFIDLFITKERLSYRAAFKPSEFPDMKSEQTLQEGAVRKATKGYYSIFLWFLGTFDSSEMPISIRPSYYIPTTRLFPPFCVNISKNNCTLSFPTSVFSSCMAWIFGVLMTSSQIVWIVLVLNAFGFTI